MANLVYRAIQTALAFKDSGGDAVITLQNLGAGVGRLSARLDRGSGSKPVRHLWQGIFQFETAPVVGEIIEIYVLESDGTYADAAVGTADAAFTAAQKNNAKLIGVVYVDTTSTGVDIIASGICEIYQRYISVAVWNGSAGDNLKNTANANLVILTPMPDEVQ